MPNPSNNSSAVLPKQNQDERRSDNLLHQATDSTYPRTPLSTDANDWFYGTQELLDALPRAWTRGLLYLLVVFAAIVLPWAMLSKVDETGRARGRIEPKGKIIRLDAPVAGTVAAIKVTEGQQVKAGQSLMELESDLVREDLHQAQAKLEGQLNRLTQLKLMKNQLEITTHTQRQQNQAQASAQLAQINQTQQQLDFNKTAITSADELLSKDQDRVKRFRSLRQQGAVSGVQVEDAERAAIESQKSLTKARSDLQQSQSELQKQQSNYEKGLREGELTILQSERQLKDMQTQIIGLQSEITQNGNQIKSLQFQLKQRVLHAPINGTIFQLPIQTAGAVVQPGQLIAQIAPKDASFVLRAKMTSQESGFLRVGLPVKLKFDAYPFQDYGVVQGRLKWIAPDSKSQDTNQGKIETFDLEITLPQPYIQTPNKRIVLTPGQTATAEVIVRQRRVIDFVLDPFKKLQKSGLKL